MTIDELISAVQEKYPDRHINLRILSQRQGKSSIRNLHKYSLECWCLTASFQLIGDTPNELHSQLHSLGES